MKTVTLGKLLPIEIKLYQDIDETPVEVYNIFNEYALRDAEIGCTIEDIDKKHINMAKLISNGKKEDALQTLNNLYQNYWNALNKINHKSLSFACLIYSVEGELTTDYSEEGLTRLINKLSKKGLNMKVVKDEVNNLKKNFRPNLN